jgi:hypothetical protein
MKKTILVFALVLGLAYSLVSTKASASYGGGAMVGAYVICLVMGYNPESMGLPPVPASMSGTPLQRELASLGASCKSLGLERQSASGFHQPWKTLSRAEKQALRTDASLARMAGR